MTFDPSKPVMTRDGRTARILCTDLAGQQPIAAAVMRRDGVESLSTHYANGEFWSPSARHHDLINVPEERTVWVNVFEDLKIDHGWASKEEADTAALKGAMIARIACIPLTYEIGEGL
jgi:cell wall assembly regulator SMI1